MSQEEDLLGFLSLPADLVYGIQTQRAINNFPRKRQVCIGSYRNLITALLWVKRAAALANERCGYLTSRQLKAISMAADQVLSENLEDFFPVHRLHGGGGTSANMNANEVLAKRAQQILVKQGIDESLSPCGELNLHQSTNDVYPTACHVAICLEWQGMDSALDSLITAFQEISGKYAGENKLARTCLQDAVSITYGDFFSGYAAAAKRYKKRFADAVDRLHSVCLGGTIVGDSAAVPPCYFKAVIPALREVSGDNGYVRHENLFDAAQNPDEMLAFASVLDSMARFLIKVGKDFRLMASGPEAGFNEIVLPAVQPGSSAMPNKVNPVIPEFLIQSCMDIIGRCHSAQMTIDHGELDLNIWESVIVCNILDAIDLLEMGITSFVKNCLNDMRINAEILEKYCSCSTSLVEKMSRIHGYEAVSKLCQRARMEKRNIKDVLREQGMI